MVRDSDWSRDNDELGEIAECQKDFDQCGRREKEPKQAKTNIKIRSSCWSFSSSARLRRRPSGKKNSHRLI